MAVALLLSHVGDLRRQQGFLEEAEAAIQEAAEIFSTEGLPLLMPYTDFLQNRLVLRAEQGRYEEALADAGEATAIVKSLGDDDALQWEWHRANIEFLQGETATAIARLERGIERALTRPAGHELFLFYAYPLLAACRMISGESELAYVAASEALRRSLNQNRSDESDPMLLTVIELLGLVAVARGEVARGARLVGKSESRVEPSSYRLDIWARMLPDLRRRLLHEAEKREHASPEEMERWKAEGRAFTMEMAIAEALKV
jgi:tetratricopeptide (TPR) repeat protein